MENKHLHDNSFEKESKIEFIDPEKRKQEEREEMRAMISDNKGKILSLIIACLYLVLGSLAGGGQGFFGILLFLILPLSLIWFSDALGGHTGSSWGLGGTFYRRIDAPTPAIILKIAGWILLFYPFIKAIFVAILTTH